MNENRTWETDMSDAFDRRVRDLHEAPLSFEQVARRARGIRRRRQAAVAGGVLAVAAVITPIAVVVADNGPGRDSAPPVATQSPTPSATDSAGLPDPGPVPVIGRLEGSTFVRGDGVRFDLPGVGYTRADDLGPEIVAYRVDEILETTLIEVLDAPAGGGKAKVVDRLPAAVDYVTSPNGLAIAWLTPGGELMARAAGGQVSYGRVPDGAFPTTMGGGADCETDATGCVVYLESFTGSGNQTVTSVTQQGVQDDAVPGVLTVRDADAGGLVSVQSSSEIDGSCGGLYDTGSNSYRFETCDYTVGGISPSGSAVLAGPAYLDGAGDPFVAILDQDGRELGRYDAPAGGIVVSRAWEGPGHVVFTVFANGSWSVWRLSTEGDVQQLTDPVKGDDFDPPVRFFE